MRPFLNYQGLRKIRTASAPCSNRLEFDHPGTEEGPLLLELLGLEVRVLVLDLVDDEVHVQRLVAHDVPNLLVGGHRHDTAAELIGARSLLFDLSAWLPHESLRASDNPLFLLLVDFLVEQV